MNNRGSFLLDIFSKFSYPQKFMLISILFSISIFTSMYFMLESQNTVINFTSKELNGIHYLQAVSKILDDVPKHRLMLKQYLKGNKSLKGDLISVESQILSNFRFLQSIDAEYEDSLETRPSDFQKNELPNLKPVEIEKKWNELSQQAFDITPEASDKAHLNLVDDLTDLINYIGDTANLKLDSGINTYYLITAYLDQMSIFQIWLPQINVLIEKLFEEKKISPEEQEKVLELLTLLQFSIDRTKKSIDRSLIQNKKLYANSETENHLKESLTKYTEIQQEYLTKIKQFIAAPSEHTMTEYLNLRQRVINENTVLWEMLSVQIEGMLKERIFQLKLRQFYTILITVTIAFLAFILGVYIMREISRPLTSLVRAANNLASGDLSTRVPVIYKDEVGQAGMAFNQMAESFQELIGQLQWAGIQLTASTTEIAAAAKEQESTVIQQEATTKQIAVTAREISTTAKDFAKTMNEVSNSAEQTSSLAASGKAELYQMETIMRQMVDASGNIASKLAVLNEKAGNITSVVTTITKVADQTNLLSLNAAIEAEKAGEHGRSFAVIAREIRRLADQTANATFDIEKTVSEMISAVSAGVMGMDKFSEEIHTGVNQVSTVSEQLTKIIEQVQQQTTSFENVNQGMQAQSLGAEQINESILELSEAAMQTSDSLHQFRKAIDQLNNAAQEMQSAVIKIKR